MNECKSFVTASNYKVLYGATALLYAITPIPLTVHPFVCLSIRHVVASFQQKQIR